MSAPSPSNRWSAGSQTSGFDLSMDASHQMRVILTDKASALAS